MKSRNLLALMLALSFSAAYAQSEEQVLNSDPIDVDGYLKEKQVTDGELEQIKSEIRKQKNEVQLNKDKSKSYNELSKTTEKLSDTTEDFIDSKKSAQKDIAEYNAKIKCLMEETPGKDCDKYVRNRNNQEAQAPVEQEVKVQQAAATSVVEAPSAAPTGAAFEEIKLLPYAGTTQYNGKVEQLEAELAAGLRLESNITTRFSMGMGVNYSGLKTNDFANNMYSVQNYGNGYQSREIQYKSMGIDLYGKFFITKGERFRPYLGAGLGYNRASAKYTENNNNNTFNNGNMYNFGGEEYKTSYFSGQVMAGTEIMITKGFGINIEAAYSSGLGNSVSSQSAKNAFNNPDQNRLRDLGNEIINSSAMSVFAGAVVIF